MKKIQFLQLLAVIAILSCQSCEDVAFLPAKGTIDGIITDNNGEALQGVQITASFEEPSQSGQAFENNKTAITDSEGYYRMDNLWDKVYLSVNHSSFLPASTLVELKNKTNWLTADFTLSGSPTIIDVNLSKTVLSATEPDTVTISVEVQDEFNNIAQGYICNLLFYRPDGSAFTVLNADLESQGFKEFLFNAIITTGLLPSGVYTIAAEARDPDGNEHRVKTSSITVE